MGMKLDISKKYEYQDRAEHFWRFTFESIAGEEGWFAWIKRPDSKEHFCVGKVSEKELIQKLESNPPPLNDDDLIDLNLWINHGGLEAYTPRKKRRKTKKEVQE